MGDAFASYKETFISQFYRIFKLESDKLLKTHGKPMAIDDDLDFDGQLDEAKAIAQQLDETLNLVESEKRRLSTNQLASKVQTALISQPYGADVVNVKLWEKTKYATLSNFKKFMQPGSKLFDGPIEYATWTDGPYTFKGMRHCDS